ncbi:MAG: hypothetical protein HYR64_07225 [Fimbriimonas ginsengisoli]|uniref:DUF6036 domain-containing protein n=1 Tax=Fimbriimonas ginsengisoli TaxID=1005039 RepID=A0A931LY44_FIMGI|nr:hypothetical protein [Fimbriimonas ginsengisoli]
MEVFLPVFRQLEAANVRYLAVGGLATVLHGHARFTADIDMIVHLEERNCRAAIETLTQLGFRPRAPVDPFDFADRSKREEWIRDKGLTVFSFYGTTGLPIEVDIFVTEPLDFDELWERREDRLIEGVTIHLIDKASLIKLKSMSARPQDLEDIKALMELGDE